MSNTRLTIPKFDFGSPLTDLVIRLDHLREKKLSGTTPAPIFYDLKRLFHILESIQSARIEGNRTTIAEIIDAKIERNTFTESDEGIREIENIEKALNFIDENIDNEPITRMLISHVHSIIVEGLSREGSVSPGDYRKGSIYINKSFHHPPESLHVRDLMDELFGLINQQDEGKYDLLKIAVAHHRFTWIHPFDNGNGRMSRLLTYAMLVKYGFNVEKGERILNPTGLFCVNRQKYYDMLSDADQNGNEGMVRWCEYVLRGLFVEIEKIDKLTQFEYLQREILIPAIDYAVKVESIRPEEHKVLKKAITSKVLAARGLKEVFPDYYPVKISRLIREMKDKKYLHSFPRNNSKSYMFSFSQSKLLRFVSRELMQKGFVMIDEKEQL